MSKKKVTKSKKLLLKVQDVAHILNFYGNFEIEIPSYLVLELGQFLEKPTAYRQNKIKLAQARAMVESSHPAFTDPMMAPIIAESKRLLKVK